MPETLPGLLHLHLPPNQGLHPLDRPSHQMRAEVERTRERLLGS